MKKIEVRTVKLVKKDNLFIVSSWTERISKTREFLTLVTAQSHAKRLLRKEGTVLHEESLALD